MVNERENIDAAWQEMLNNEASPAPKTPDFKFFITTFSLQAAIFMGVIENPVTKKKEENFPQAKFIIDTLLVLKQKTSGNLNKEETEILDNLLYELRAQYIAKTTKPTS
jgi:hypothetical protein